MLQTTDNVGVVVDSITTLPSAAVLKLEVEKLENYTIALNGAIQPGFLLTRFALFSLLFVLQMIWIL